MSELIERCKAYGADMDATMERFVGDEELYEMCLQQFAEDPGFAGLKEAVESKDYKAAFEHAHALKGVAGNLGLSPLFDAISTLVEELRIDDYSHADEQYAVIVAEQKKVTDLLG